MAIDKIRTTAYEPSTNGSIERFHSTMHSIIAKWTAANQRDWDETLPAVAFAYCTSVHESTGFTPYFLMHGREARIPADLVYDTPDIDGSHQSDSYSHSLVSTLHDAYETARETLAHAARRQKDRYDMRSRPARFPVGSWVWCIVPRKLSGRYQKWRRLYDGPFQVMEQLGPVTYKIQKNSRSAAWIVHVDKLKLCAAHASDDNLSEIPEEETAPSDSPAVRPRRQIRPPARYRQ